MRDSTPKLTPADIVPLESDEKGTRSSKLFN